MIKRGANPKLSTRLSIALAATLLIILIIATIAAAATAYFDSREIQDETLLSVAHLVRTDQVSVQYDRRLLRDDDFDDGVMVWEIGHKQAAAFKLNQNLSDGFHTTHGRGDVWRVLLTHNELSGKRYAVAQKLSVSTELALKSAKNTALPLAGLLLLVPLLIVAIVRHSFKPLKVLRNHIESSDTLRPTGLHDQSVPYEVKPFLSSIDELLNKNHEYNERQRRFIADAAHELRTPITALSLEIENLQQAKNEQTRQQRESKLAGSVDRLQRLVSQLLDLARSQADNDEPMQSVNMNELIKSQIASVFALAEQKEINLSVTRNEPLTLMSARSQLQHVVRNGLSNAIKFTPENGNIDVEVFVENGQGVLRVLDDGPGVDTDNLSRLSEPFYRSAEHAVGTGAGLGLAICQEIADKLGGKLHLQNRQQGGFEFKYTQPAAPHIQ